MHTLLRVLKTLALPALLILLLVGLDRPAPLKAGGPPVLPVLEGGTATWRLQP